MTMDAMRESFYHRLQAIALDKKKYQTDLVTALGKNSSTVSKWWNGEIVPGAKNRRLIADYLGCDVDWLTTGEGVPFPVRYTPPPDNAINFESGKKTSLNNMVSISYFADTYASAGKGIINFDAAKEVMHFDRNFLTSQLGSSNFDNVHVIHAVGDSMTPAIVPGDLLFVNPGDKSITTGAVYVFLVGEETMVKRVKSNPISSELTLLSDNKLYDPIEILQTDRDKITVIGRVIGNFKKF